MMAPYALVGDVLAPEAIGPAAVVIRDGKIFDVVRAPRSADLPRERREVSGLICPGFVDLQINGAFGVDVGPDPKSLETLACELPKTGVTSFLPTAISWPAERYDSFLEALEDASRSSVRGYWGRTEKGRIALGADADLVVLTPEATVQETIVGGESVYRREEGL